MAWKYQQGELLHAELGTMVHRCTEKGHPRKNRGCPFSRFIPGNCIMEVVGFQGAAQMGKSGPGGAKAEIE